MIGYGKDQSGYPTLVVGIEFYVARNKKIQLAIVVVVPPGRARRPSTKSDARLLRDVRECAVVIVVVQAIFAKI